MNAAAAGDEQPVLQRVGPGFPGRAHDGALLDRANAPLPHFRLNSESFRFRESMKNKKGKKSD